MKSTDLRLPAGVSLVDREPTEGDVRARVQLVPKPGAKRNPKYSYATLREVDEAVAYEAEARRALAALMLSGFEQAQREHDAALQRVGDDLAPRLLQLDAAIDRVAEQAHAQLNAQLDAQLDALRDAFVTQAAQVAGDLEAERAFRHRNVCTLADTLDALRTEHAMTFDTMSREWRAEHARHTEGTKEAVLEMMLRHEEQSALIAEGMARLARALDHHTTVLRCDGAQLAQLEAEVRQLVRRTWRARVRRAWQALRGVAVELALLPAVVTPAAIGREDEPRC